VVSCAHVGPQLCFIYRAVLIRSEAMRLGYADAQYWIADPSVVDVPVKDLLSKVRCVARSSMALVSPTDTQEYLQKRAKLFDTKKANAQYLNGNPLPSSDTVYLTTADSEGNAVSSESGSVAGINVQIIKRSDHVELCWLWHGHRTEGSGVHLAEPRGRFHPGRR